MILIFISRCFYSYFISMLEIIIYSKMFVYFKDVKIEHQNVYVEKWRICWRNIIRRDEIVFYYIRKVKLFHYANSRARSQTGVSSALSRELFSMNDDGKLLFAHAQSPSHAVTYSACGRNLGDSAVATTAPSSIPTESTPFEIRGNSRFRARRPLSECINFSSFVFDARHCCRRRHNCNNATCFFVLYDSPSI